MLIAALFLLSARIPSRLSECRQESVYQHLRPGARQKALRRAGAPDVTVRPGMAVRARISQRPYFRADRRDLALYRVIRYGLPETEMPAHNMTQREIWQMSALCSNAGTSGRRRDRGEFAKGGIGARQRRAAFNAMFLNGEGGHLGPSLSDIGRAPQSCVSSDEVNGSGAGSRGRTLAW